LVGNAAAVGGFVAGTYWLLMLVGRFIGSLSVVTYQVEQ